MSALLLSADLLATSKLGGAAQRAGCPMQIVSSATGIVERLTAAPANLVVVDLGTMRLDLPGLVAQLRSLPVPPAILAFGPHVHEDRLQAARDAGCDSVLSRGQFHAQAEAIFRQFAG